MARRHLEVLQALPEAEVAAISSRGVERLDKLAKDFDVGEKFRDNEEMLRAVHPDAVVVAVSVANVYPVTLNCMKHGVSCLIEKPPGLTAEQTEDLLKASSGTDARYMVGLNRRFYSVMQNAGQIVKDSGGLVSVMVQAPEDMASIRAMNFHPKEVLEHWMAANGMHCIDLLRFFGGDVAFVHALSSEWRDSIRNAFGALIRFQNGAMGHYISNWTAPGRWQVTLYGFDLRVDLCPLEEGKVTRRNGKVTEVPKDEADTKFKPGFFGQDKYFVGHVKQNLPIERPGADLNDALGTMKLVEAIANSQTN
jgi:predicted dehydrogenase